MLLRRKSGRRNTRSSGLGSRGQTARGGERIQKWDLASTTLPERCAPYLDRVPDFGVSGEVGVEWGIEYGYSKIRQKIPRVEQRCSRTYKDIQYSC